MTDNRENEPKSRETGEPQKEVDIEPSEPETSKTVDPGRTPGKAEGADDESATD